MKLAYLYGIDPSNPYLSTYSHYPLTKKIKFVDDIFDDKPLLIVGINKARELYGDKIDLENNFIEKNIYWCYSPEEYLSEFLKKYENFILTIHESYLNILNFEIVDPFFKNFYNENDLIEFLSNSQIDLFYHIGKMLYCYSKSNNKIYIVNINEFTWFKLIDIKKLNEFLSCEKYYNDNDLKIQTYFINLFQNQDIFFVEKTIPYFIFTNLSN